MRDPTVGVAVTRRACPEWVEPLHEHPLVHRLLAARGVASRREFEAHTADLPTPEALPDITQAVERLLQVRERAEFLLIVGDYDCDGATSSALALLGLRAMGFTRLAAIVPNRFRDGYGLSEGLLQRVLDGHAHWFGLPGNPLPEGSPDLILTVDNGVAAMESVRAAADAGIDVVITDHHLPGKRLPAAHAHVNPNRADSRFDSRALAGVGVFFYVLLALRAELRHRGDPHGRVNLGQWLDLVAVGTLADLVPLDRVNRILVEQGLRRIRAGQARDGILALLQLARIGPEQLSSLDIGFFIAPRLNAAGRLDDMRTGIDCLIAADPATAMQAAIKLDAMNSERRQIQARMRREADEQIQALLADVPDVNPQAGVAAEVELGLHAGRATDARFGLVLFDEAWHEGIIGILAGCIKDQQHRPVAVFAAAGGGLLKGSVRSIQQVHVRDVLARIDATTPGLIVRFGGHAMAAGLTIAPDDLPEFRAAFDAEVAHRLGERLPGREFATDGPLKPDEMSVPMARWLRTMAPWGSQFDAPLFDGIFEIVDARVVGHEHLKLRVQGVNSKHHPEGLLIDVIGFGLGNQQHLALSGAGAHVHIVYELSVNRYRERESVQLMMRYMCRA